MDEIDIINTYMRVHRTLIILAFILSFFVQTNVLLATQQDADLQVLTTNLTVKAKGVLEQGEENLKKAVDTLSQKKFILKNQAAVVVAEAEAAAQTPKLSLWRKMIHTIAEPLIPLFTPRDVVFKNNVMQVAQATPVTATPISATVVVPDAPKASAPASKRPIAITTPRVIIPQISNRTVVQNVSESAIEKLRAEMLIMNGITRTFIKDLEDAKVNSLARSLDRSFSPIIQQVNNLSVANNGGGNLNFSETVDGLDYAGGVLSTTAGYAIPLTASTSEWGTFYQTPSTRITAGANCSWVGNVFNCTGGSGSGATTTINGVDGPTFAFNPGTAGTDFNIATSTGTVTFNIPTASAAARGLLSTLDYARIPATASSTNWNSFYDTPSSRITAGANLAWVGNTLGFNGILPIANGGTGTSTVPTYGKLLMGNAGGTYDLVATSSLGITSGGSGTVNSGTTGQIPYYAANGTAVSATSSLFMGASGDVGIGTVTPNALMHIYRATPVANDNFKYIQLGLANVAHGITDFVPTSTFGSIGPTDTSYGGMYLAGYVDDAVPAVTIDGYNAVAPSAVNTSISIRGWKKSGTGRTALTGTEGLFSISAGSSERFRILADGSVGIGTTSPYAKLSVAGTIVGANFVGTTTATSTLGGGIDIASGCFAVNGTCIGTGGGSGTVNSGTTGQLAYYASSGTAVSATSTLFLSTVGNVGIGTTTPASALDVTGIISINGYRFGFSPTGLSDVGSTVGIGYGALANLTTGVRNVAIGKDALMTITGGYDNTAIGAGALDSAQTTSNSNVAIGRSSGDALTSGGSNTFLGTLSGKNVTTGSNNIVIGYNISAASTTGSNQLNIGGILFGDLAGGNVGIGTTSPYAKLSVAGTIVGANFVGTTTATSTLGGGIDIASGCFAVNGTCIGTGGGSGTVGSGTTGQIPYYAANGTALSATSTLFISSSGSIGMGTTTPTALLHVVVASGNPDIFKLTNSTGYDAFSIDNGTLKAKFYNGGLAHASLGFGGARGLGSDGSGLGLITANLTRMTITSAGNVGIGTTSPVAVLSVTGTAGVTSDVFVVASSTQSKLFFVTAAGAITAASTIAWSANGNILGNNTIMLNGNNASVIGNASSGSSANVTLQGGANAASSLTLKSTTAVGTTDFVRVVVGTDGGTEGFRVISNGNMGIGTTSPYAKLSVAGTIVGANFVGTTTATSTLGGGIDIASGCFAINGTCISSGGGSGTVNSGTTGQIPYYAANGTAVSATSSLFMSASGNVGIGTTTTTSKLSFVQGGISPWNNANGGIVINNSLGGSIAGFTNSVSGDYAGMSFYKPGGVADAGDLQFYALGSSYVPVGLFTPATSIIAARSNFTNGLKIGAEAGPVSLYSGGIAASNIGFVLSTAGNVGIGTTTPGSKLQVYDGGDSASITTFTQGLGSAGMHMTSDFADGNYTPGLFWSTTNNNPSKPKAGIFTRNTNTGAFLYMGTSNAYATGITNTAITIDPSGNVGIGTSTPAAKLTVDGRIQVTGNASPTTGEGFELGYMAGASAESIFTSYSRDSAAYKPLRIDASKIVMNINSGGNVGIGSTTPQGVLTVQNVGSGHSFVVEDQAGDATPFFISSSGSVVSGHNDTVGTNEFQAGNQNGGVFQAFKIDSTTNAEDILGFFAFGTTDGGRSGLAGMKGIAAEAISAGNEGTGLGFFTTPITGSANAERVRITAAGNVGIGTTTPGVALSVVGNAQFTAVTSGAYSSDLNITSDGTLTTSASDIRLKENLAEITAPTLEKLKQLKAHTFTWKTDPNHRTDVGLIAQDVEFVFPELVFTNKTDGFKGVNYSRLSIFLLKGIQEQQIQFEELQKYTSVLKLKELHTEKLCVGSENDEVCITREDLRNLLQGHSVQNSNTGGGAVVPISTVPVEPTGDASTTPVIPTTTGEVEGDDTEPTPTAEETPIETPTETSTESTLAEPTPTPTPEPPAPTSAAPIE